MKKSLYILMLLILSLALFSCSDDDNENKDTEGFTVTIASKKRGDDSLYPYYAKIEGEIEWSRFRDIQGFAHENGYEYILSVKSNAVIGNQYIIEPDYTLIKIISKIKKESEDLPE